MVHLKCGCTLFREEAPGRMDKQTEPRGEQSTCSTPGGKVLSVREAAEVPRL